MAQEKTVKTYSKEPWNNYAHFTPHSLQRRPGATFHVLPRHAGMTPCKNTPPPHQEHPLLQSTSPYQQHTTPACVHCHATCKRSSYANTENSNDKMEKTPTTGHSPSHAAGANDLPNLSQAHRLEQSRTARQSRSRPHHSTLARRKRHDRKHPNHLQAMQPTTWRQTRTQETTNNNATHTRTKPYKQMVRKRAGENVKENRDGKAGGMPLPRFVALNPPRP